MAIRPAKKDYTVIIIRIYRVYDVVSLARLSQGGGNILARETTSDLYCCRVFSSSGSTSLNYSKWPFRNKYNVYIILVQ